MDVSKFTLDRNAYINTASALYDQTKTVSAASAYGMVGVDFHFILPFNSDLDFRCRQAPT
jgi:hypothetical protein